MKIKIAYLLSLLLTTFAISAQVMLQNIEIKEWKMRQVGSVKPIATDWINVTAPGCVHTDLLSNKLIEDPFYRTNEKDQQWIDKANWEYKTIIKIDKPTFTKANISLVFKGLDTYADVYINDKLALSANNMFREWAVNLKPFIKEGDNEIRIFFNSPIQKGLVDLAKLGYALQAPNDQSANGEMTTNQVSVFTRKAGYHYGWDWGPRFVTSGIWRPVYLVAYDNAKIENVQYIQKSITTSNAEIKANVEINSTKNQKAIVKITDQNNDKVLSTLEVNLVKGSNTIAADFAIQNPKLWWSRGLGEAYLYKLKAEIVVDGKVEDNNLDKIGLRTIKIVQDKDEKGTSFYVELNGVPVFCKGANYIPNDNFLNRVDEKRYKKVIKDAVDANMNMLRVWGGGFYENDIFYNLCDENGLLLWHDFMFACSVYPGDSAFLNNVKQEAIQNVKRLRNHPSIALWCGNNEMDQAWANFDEKNGWGWKQKYSKEQREKIWKDYQSVFASILPQTIKEYDNRFYWASSPLAEEVDNKNRHALNTSTSGDMHYWGVWHAKKPFEDFKVTIGRFVSEYGFQSFPEFKSVKKYTIPSDWNIESEVMSAHQRAGIGNLRIKEYLEWYYQMPKDFENFLYVGQVLQAEGMKVGFEAHRRKKPYCMGSLYWQINDCWPVASWSSTDYYGNWKALHYFAKKAYEDVLVSPSLDKDVFSVSIVSDKLLNSKGTLNLKIVDFDGTEKWAKSLDLDVAANTSKIYFSAKTKEILKNIDTSQVVFKAQFLENGKVLTQNVFYFSKVKNLKLPKPEIKYTVSKTPKGYQIELSSNKIAKNVYLDVPDEEGFFTDNYMDILPGTKTIIDYETTKEIADLSKKLKVISLVDSY